MGNRNFFKKNLRFIASLLAELAVLFQNCLDLLRVFTKMRWIVFYLIFSSAALVSAGEMEKILPEDLLKLQAAFVKDFTANTFNKLPKFERDQIALEILTASKEVNPHLPPEVFAQRKGEILMLYLSTIGPEEKQNLYRYAFTMTANEEDTTHLFEYFELATNGDTTLMREYMCEAFKSMSTQDESLSVDAEKTAQNSVKLDKLYPLLQNYPQIINQNCLLNTSVGTFNFNIADSIYVVNPKMAFDLKNQKGKPMELKESVDPSFCSEEQLEKHLFKSISPMLKFKSALKNIVSIKDNGCKLHGLISKDDKNQFVYEQNFALPGKKKSKFTFFSLKELVTQLKTVQQLGKAGSVTPSAPSTVQPSGNTLIKTNGIN